MSNLLDLPIVLVLNSHWQAVNVRSPKDAIVQLAGETATALDVGPDYMNPVKWSDWINLPIRENDAVVHTSRLSIRIPTIIILENFSRVPKKAPKLSPAALRARDNNTCQYTGRRLAPNEGNIDHVTPRAKGGETSWKNCVLAHRDVNSRKADRLPAEVGLRLLREPQEPRALPVTAFIQNRHGIPDWEPFLIKRA